MTAIRDLKAREAGLTVAAVAGTAGTAAVELAESKETDLESTGKKNETVNFFKKFSLRHLKFLFTD